MQRSQSAGSISSTLPGRAGDAGVVDQAVEPAELGERLRRRSARPASRSETSHAARSAAAGSLARQLRECGRVDVADVHPRAFAHEGPRDRQPDAAGAGRDHHAQSAEFQVHRYTRPPQYSATVWTERCGTIKRSHSQRGDTRNEPTTRKAQFHAAPSSRARPRAGAATAGARRASPFISLRPGGRDPHRPPHAAHRLPRPARASSRCRPPTWRWPRSTRRAA